MEGLGVTVWYTLEGSPFITNTVVNTWIIMGLLLFASLVTTRRLQTIPGPLQNVMEILVDGIHWLVDSTMGKAKRGFAPYMLTLSLFLVLANLAGLVAVRQPTADLNTTFALAGLTFLMVQYYGFKSKGAAYLKRFFEPIAFLFPLNIISEIALPVSLSFRLFGNMLGSLIIMLMLYYFAPAVLPVIGHAYFDIFAGVIQSFIFVMLTMTFITLAMD